MPACKVPVSMPALGEHLAARDVGANPSISRLVLLGFSGYADDRERGGLACSRESLNPLDALRPAEDVLHNTLLRPIEMEMLSKRLGVPSI